jgi:hypothetical protein
LIAPAAPGWSFVRFEEVRIMTLKTCAACDCELDAHPIEVKIGGHTVEVCCLECARALNEAEAATGAAVPQQG